ncbi:membrane protein [Oceanicola sp. 22II-s10i]|uniref:autotransporter assembly complex protein TamA n=1 Tax=Oceanicola sp. 22II-s10i TaxID=1317116 RepID=UPI000B520A8C|nr:BamA/TamA family outer membrane protein [Oceanicola sp. 22II-s10i]OWU83345.1 membrane protein [Oceanicola sp. 22II-s10i]
MFRPLAASLIAGLTLSTASLAAEVDVVVPGNYGDLTDDLRAASLSVRTVDEGTTDGQDLIAAAKADYRRMLAALYEAGHFSGAVSIKVDGREAANLSVLNRVPSVNRIEIQVTPGPTFRFSRAQIAPLPQGETPAEGYAAGELATTPVMREAAEKGVTDWREDGHAKAAVSGQQITANHAANTIAADIRLAPGPRLSFGRTLLTPETANSSVRAERIRAIAGLPEGEVFSPQEVTTAERRLRRTGAFRSAVVNEAETPNADGTLDMIVDVEDAKPRRFGAGVELSSTEGVAVTGYWMHRNFFGGAERFRVDGNIGGYNGDLDGIDYGISASLTRPAFRHPDMNLRFGALLQHLDEPGYRADLAEATVGIERFITENLTAELDFGVRLSSVDDAFGSRNFNHIIGRGKLQWDRRDDDLDPRRGLFAEVEAEPFIGFDGSDTGARLYGDFRGYYPLGESFSLAGRVQAGSVLASTLAQTPPDYLFFSGGGGTVRGQDYQSLGGSVVGGEVVGGRSFVGLSGEIRTKITQNIGLVGFVDYGYVASGPDFTGGDWHAGAGVGGRYYTPIGPIRFDVAVPISGESGFGVYVGIGQSF